METITISKEKYEKMKIELKRLKKLGVMDKILSKSKFTEKDALEIGREINKGIAKRHGLIK